MKNMFFWRSWHPASRRVYVGMLILLFIVIISFINFYPRGILNVVSWERISELKEVPVAQDPISVGLFSFSYSLDYNLVVETFLGSTLHLSSTAPLMLLLAVSIAWVVLLTVISAADRFWYYVGILLVIGLILLFQLEQLRWFGQVNKIGVVIAFTLFLPPTFYFQQINRNFGLTTRLAVFITATVLFGILAALFTEVPHPAITLAYYGMGVPLVLSLVFIMIVGHELISFFTTIVTQNNTPQSSKSLLHLSVLSVVYLANLGLLMMKNTGALSWDIIYLDAFWLLLTISIIGLWGFQQRESQYKFLFPFAPIGALVYISLGLVALSTVVFLSWQGNDPLLESLEDCIVYSQIGFSAIFLLYLIANFIQPFMQNQQVYRVMYQPKTLPYATALIGGAVATLGLFAQANFFPYYQLVAGYYNGIGDLHWLTDELFVAEQYYKLSNQYANNNHRANYSLGALAREQGDPLLTAFYFQEALNKKPTPLAYANTSAAYQVNNQYFDALFTLKKGVKEFEKNAYLQNNLAMAYGRTDILDSALFWLSRASENVKTRTAAEANSLALIGQKRNQIDIATDSILADFVTSRDYPPSLINILTLQGQQPSDSLNFPMKPELPVDSVLTNFTYAQLRNYLLQADPIDTSFVRHAEALTESGPNIPYTEALLLAEGQVLYKQNQVVEAFKKLDRLQSINVFKQNYYLDIIGLWALDQHSPRYAIRYFAQLAERNYKDARVKFAVCLTEALASPDVSLTQVRQSWLELLQDSTQSTFHDMANQMYLLLNKTYSETATDIERYQWLRYRAHELKENELNEAFDAFEDKNYLVLGLYDMLEEDPVRYKEWVRPRIQALRKEEDALNYQAAIYLEWAWALSEVSPTTIPEQGQRITMLVPLTRWQQYEKQFYQAALAEARQQTSEARQQYEKLLGNPFFEKGFVEAVNYLFSEKEEEISYQYWLDAIQTNPYSPLLREEYMLSALRLGLENYAEESLSDYREMVSNQQFQAFKLRFDETKEAYAIAF
ncbi:MAG: hypothetical protein RIG62_26710 [Cyclobacteriaceae bacterium]